QQGKNRDKHYKHKMSINLNLAIGIIKDDLIRMALQEDPEKRGAIFEDIIQGIARNLVPVREGRRFQRKKKYPIIKYPTTKKRSY
ncbi:MAG: IS4/IS5 family transposase, partial [Bacillota bacterium]|nr:IS4/IS5 family transposase [Bacillota bacterium]